MMRSMVRDVAVRYIFHLQLQGEQKDNGNLRERFLTEDVEHWALQHSVTGIVADAANAGRRGRNFQLRTGCCGRIVQGCSRWP